MRSIAYDFVVLGFAVEVVVCVVDEAESAHDLVEHDLGVVVLGEPSSEGATAVVRVGVDFVLDTLGFHHVDIVLFEAVLDAVRFLFDEEEEASQYRAELVVAWFGDGFYGDFVVCFACGVEAEHGAFAEVFDDAVLFVVIGAECYPVVAFPVVLIKGVS